jgi:hypothetical protein
MFSLLFTGVYFLWMCETGISFMCLNGVVLCDFLSRFPGFWDRRFGGVPLVIVVERSHVGLVVVVNGDTAQ